MNFHLAKPTYYSSVLLKTGLTNFSGKIDQALPLTLIENGIALMNTIKATTTMNKFSAGNFVSFVVKRKKPVRQGHVKVSG